MKKTLAFALAALLLLLPGCAGQTAGTLDFLRRPARITLKPDGTELSPVVETALTDGGIVPVSLTITAPEALSGITFRFAGDPPAVTAETERLSIPLGEGAGEWLTLWAAAFLFTEDDVLTCDGQTLTAGAAGGRVTLTLSAENGLPTHVELDAGGVTRCAAVVWEPLPGT